MLTRLKQQVQKMLAVEARTAHRAGLTPNMITCIGAVLAFFSATAFALWQSNTFYLFLAAVLLLLSGFCDALDGAVARLFSQASAFGGFLDSLLDRYADAAVYTGIVVSGLSDVPWGLAALIGSLLVSYTRARAEASGTKMETVGLAERPERIVILAVAGVTAAFWQPRVTMNACVVLLAVLTNLTVLQRSIYAYKKLKRNGKANT